MENKERFKVLVIDDESAVRNLLRDVLKEGGYEAICAENGQAGIDAFKTQKPHATLVDNLLPDLPGLEVVKKIREIEPDAVILMITGVYAVTLEKRARELGVVDFIRKDLFNVQSFLKMVDVALCGAQEALAETGGKALRIVIADNRGATREVLADFLKKKGCFVYTMSNGQEAYKCIQEVDPHFILLDLNIEGLPAMTVLEKLRVKPPKSKKGIFVLSYFNVDLDVVNQACSLGACEYIPKPQGDEQLCQAVWSKILQHTS